MIYNSAYNNLKEIIEGKTLGDLIRITMIQCHGLAFKDLNNKRDWRSKGKN